MKCRLRKSSSLASHCSRRASDRADNLNVIDKINLVRLLRSLQLLYALFEDPYSIKGPIGANIDRSKPILSAMSSNLPEDSLNVIKAIQIKLESSD